MNTDITSKYEAAYESLKRLAMDLHWSWNHATDKIWRQLDPVLWDLTHNPLVVLQTVSNERIQQVLKDPIVVAVIDELMEGKKQSSIAPAWFQKTYPDSPITTVAYFSMEFMVSEALPIYSGGLGNVAGDHLKTASDLGVPVVGVGLLYQQGYTRQVIFKDGSQQYLAPYNDPGQLPITPIRNANGEWLRIELKLPGYSLWLRTWKAQVGRTTIFLLDSNDTANFPVHRGITGELYGSGIELRLMQELVLGIGGWRLLKALGIEPEVCHLNEGHTAFVILERVADLMEKNNFPFETAMDIVRAGTIFTTHTAVGAGFDVFPSSLIKKYLGQYAREKLKIQINDLLALGRIPGKDESAGFNTGFFAINGSGFINGVSKLHENVSRKLFSHLFPRWPIDEIPIGHVTNGVHMPTWDSPEADKIWTETCGKDRWLGRPEELKDNIAGIPDERLWELKLSGKEIFIKYIRERYKRQLATIGMSTSEIAEAGNIFDAEVLTLGFARRFVSYKRPGLLLKDPERLKKILLNKEHPVQLIIAGKAHSGDLAGQAMIKEWIQFIHTNNLQHKVIFLSDYDMLLTEHLVQGVDLWLNMPQRPWEACGTSGMKVLVNGGINLSTLDGWWDEAYDPQFGWAVGKGSEETADGNTDIQEANEIYNLLENEIIPEFYLRTQEGIPVGWVKKMRESMAKLTPYFSSNRSLCEYLEKYYLPAAKKFLHRKKDYGKKAIEIKQWKQLFNERSSKIYFGNFTIEEDQDKIKFNVPVYLNGLDKDAVRVELYADGIGGRGPEKHEMYCMGSILNEPDLIRYNISLPAIRPASDYTPRIIPKNIDISIPLECSFILWHH